MVHSKCFVPFCTSGYKTNKEKVALYGTTDLQRIEVWKKVIPRDDKTFTSKDRVCAKHFKKDDIVSTWKSENDHLVVVVPLKQPYLKADAIPSIFPSPPKKSKQPKKSGKRRRKTKTSSVSPMDNTETEELNSTLPIQFISCDNESTFQFDDLLANGINMPTSFWSKHLMDFQNNPVIIFSELTMSETTQMPILYKQVIINNNLDMKISVYDKDITYEFQKAVQCNVQKISSEAINDVLVKFNELGICRGGPKSTLYPFMDCLVNYACVDRNTACWRHPKCAYVLSDETSKNGMCKHCSSLFDSSNIEMKRHTAMKKNLSSYSKTCKVVKLRQLQKQECTTKRKIQLRLQKIGEKLKECQEKYEDFCEKDVVVEVQNNLNG